MLVVIAACGRVGFEARTGDGGQDVSNDAAAAIACGKTSLLADNFDGATASPQWFEYVSGGITTVQASGALVITLPATTPATSNYGGYDSTWSYDLRGSRMYVEVLETTSAATHAETDIQVIGHSGHSLEMGVEAGQLYAATYDGAILTTITSVPYDGAQQLWWQLREDSGTVYYEYSADGVTFTQLATTPTPSWIDVAAVVLEAGSYQTETNAGKARFDNLNGGTPSGAWCRASSLRDDFSSGVIGDEWAGSYQTGGCTYSETGGVFDISLASTGTAGAALVSASGYDLTGDAVFAALSTPPAADSNVFTYLRASTSAGDNVEVTLIGSSLVAAENVGTTFSMLASVPYDPVAHRFWQLAESGGMLAWQTSPDGVAWTTQFSSAPPISLVGVNLSIGAGTTDVVASPGHAIFSTFDQLPP